MGNQSLLLGGGVFNQNGCGRKTTGRREGRERQKGMKRVDAEEEGGCGVQRC